MSDILWLASYLIPIAIAIGAAFFVIIFLILIYNNVIWGTCGAIATYVLQNISNAPLKLGINLFIADLFFLGILLIVTIKIANDQLPKNDKIAKLWLLITAIWFGSFSIGLFQYKTAAGVEFRNFFYIACATLYILCFRHTDKTAKDIFKCLYAAAHLLIVLAVFRWIAYATGNAGGEWFDPGTPLRVLGSSPTLVIAVAMLPGLAMWMGFESPEKWMKYSAPFMLLAVLVLGHRTVWVVVFICLGTGWLLAGKDKKANRSGLLIPLMVGGLFLATLFILLPESKLTQEFHRGVAETQKENSTFAWRLDSWTALIKDWASGSPNIWLFGKPFGAGYRRFIEVQGMETNVQAHSHYVTLLVRGGILVLLAYVAVQSITLWRLLKNTATSDQGISKFTLVLFVVANIIYAITYSPDFMQAFFLGLSYSLAPRPPKEKYIYH